jgi:hypothetical protein
VAIAKKVTLESRQFTDEIINPSIIMEDLI